MYVISVAQTWLARSILSSRSRYGIDLVGRVLLARVGLAVQRLDAHALHQRGHVPAPDVEALAVEHVAQHAAAREGMRQVDHVDALHQPLIGLGRGARQVVHVASADAHQLGLARDRQGVVAVDHRFALSMPALVSAPDKKSFSKASWPILACSSFRSTGAGDADSPPNTLAARSSNWFFQSLIWFGCTSCNLANSASVFSPSNGVQGHLGLEDRRVVAAGSLAHGPSAFPGIEPDGLSQSVHLSPCPDFRGHLSMRCASRLQRRHATPHRSSLRASTEEVVLEAAACDRQLCVFLSLCPAFLATDLRRSFGLTGVIGRRLRPVTASRVRLVAR